MTGFLEMVYRPSAILKTKYFSNNYLQSQRDAGIWNRAVADLEHLGWTSARQAFPAPRIRPVSACRDPLHAQISKKKYLVQKLARVSSQKLFRKRTVFS